MTPSLESSQEYERYIYSLPSLYPEIESSTLVFIRAGRYIVKITGEVLFKQSLRLKVLQVVDFGRSEILRYSYTIFRAAQFAAPYSRNSRVEGLRLITHSVRPQPDFPARP